MGKAIERIFLPLMRTQLPEVRDICMPAEGVFHNLILVSMRKVLPRACAQSDARDLGFGTGDVQQVHRCGGRRCGCAERSRSGMESVQQYRSPARYRILHGAGGFARSREPLAGLWFEDGRRCDTKIAGEGFTRRWPNVIKMSPDVVKRVDDLWKRAGL